MEQETGKFSRGEEVRFADDCARRVAGRVVHEGANGYVVEDERGCVYVRAARELSRVVNLLSAGDSVKVKDDAPERYRTISGFSISGKALELRSIDGSVAWVRDTGNGMMVEVPLEHLERACGLVEMNYTHVSRNTEVREAE